MNSQVGYNQQIPIHIDQSGSHSIQGTHCHPSGYGKRTIQPWRTKHTAIFLHIKPDIFLFHHKLCVGFKLQRRRVTVTSHNLKSHIILIRNPKGNQGGIISCHIISSSPFKLPALSLQKPVKTCFVQHPFHILHSMKAGGTPIQKCHQLLVDFFKHVFFLYHSALSPVNPFSTFFSFSKFPSLKQYPSIPHARAPSIFSGTSSIK